MNAQLLLRLTQIKQYINTLNDTLTLNDHTQAANVVTKFKKSMIKSDQRVHASQFVLDCLRTRNEKLRHELEEMQQQKKGIETKLHSSKTNKNEIKPCKIQIYITRITLSLNESKKVEYDEASIGSDYKNIYVNSSIGNKYKDYPISIQEIQQLEQKVNLLYLCVFSEQVFHIIIRFKNERQAMKWGTCLKYGLMIIKNRKKKEKLFQEQKETNTNVQVSPPQVAHAFPFRSSMVKGALNVPQIPFLNLSNQNKPISPSESVISEKKYTEKSFEKEMGDKYDKNTERSLINALNYDGNQSSGTFYVKQTVNTHYQKRLDLNRPPTLTKLRNSSSHDYNGTYEMNKSKFSGYRKQSEDITKQHINQVYQDKMMQNLRSKQESQDEIKSQSTFKMSTPLIQKLHSNSPEKSDKLKNLQEKKKELLRQSNQLSLQKPAFTFDNKVSWMGIEEREDQNKSKSSNRVSNKSRRGSEFSESVMAPSSEQIKKEIHEQEQSQHITQKSQEESPKLSKILATYEVPHKVSYNNGIVFQLHQVEKGNSSPLLPSKTQISQKENLYHSPSSSSDDSEDDDHSDPSSHQNHTESEDNNARAQELKKGIILTKCSENGFWPHEKILYLSQNENELCCRDLKDKKIKKIKLANIKEVQYKKFDKGIIKHISKIEEDKCFVIRALDQQNKIKNFQFVSNLAQPLERFATNLKLYVEYFKQE